MRVVPLILLALCASCTRERPGTPPEHVLLITVENLRADHTHMWQYPRHTTFIERPDDQRSLDLDFLMERGVLFHEAFAPSGSTRPSLATLFTGLPPRAHGLLSPGGVLSDDVPTIAERFKAAGFQTAGFASPSSPLAESGLSRGFDVFVEDHTEIVYRDGVPVDGLLMRAFEYMRTEFDPQKPQLLWLHFGSPAPPWEPKAVHTSTGLIDFQTRYVDAEYEGSVESNIGFLEKVNKGEVSLSAVDRDALIGLYDGDLERANFLLRQLLEIYKHHFEVEEEVWDRTLVVTAGLSGCELGERGYYGSEESLHAQGLHVPLAFHHPRSLTGRRIFEDLVGLADVAPTLSEWMLLEPFSEPEGRSLLARTDRERSLEPRPVIAELPGGLISARIDGWRLLLNRDGVAREGAYEVSSAELYDTANDPSELEDVSGERPEVLGDLMRAVAEWERRFPRR
ncbi:MAG: sulfatase-like hydrolase/transferase [Planctomycetota bacterium]|nr:sulfatase-like hydrolase/transferase [Planctomycetota bacterium]